MNNKIILIILAVGAAVAAGGAGFFAGMKYQQSKTPTQTSRFGNGQGTGQGNRTGRFSGGRPVNGSIISADDKSITVKMQDGSSKIVLLSDKTTISKASTGAKSDLMTGTTVAAFGTDNSDGSLTATNIQINPINVFGASDKAPNTGTKSADAREIVIEGSNYKFLPNAITAKKGEKIRLVLTNTGGTHDLVIDQFKVATARIQGGASDWFEFTPDTTGTFEFYCSVDGHRAMGMTGTLVVQ